MKEPTKYIITNTTDYPVTIAEVKEHLNITDDNEDSLLESYIKAATEYVENVEDLAYSSKSIIAIYDNLYSTMKLPLSFAYSIESIIYRDSNNISQVLDTSLYELDIYNTPSVIRKNIDVSYPSVSTNNHNPVIVNYTTGFNQRAIPQRIYQAILLLVGHFYENREATTSLSLKEVPMAVSALLFDRNY